MVMYGVNFSYFPYFPYFPHFPKCLVSLTPFSVFPYAAGYSRIFHSGGLAANDFSRLSKNCCTKFVGDYHFRAFFFCWTLFKSFNRKYEATDLFLVNKGRSHRNEDFAVFQHFGMRCRLAFFELKSQIWAFVVLWSLMQHSSDSV